jgi:DNA-binding CsgD family transcriptional regulator
MASLLCQKLSPQERRVLWARSNGLTFKAAAADLKLSIHTCKNYMRSVFRKTGTHSTTEAVAALSSGSGFVIQTVGVNIVIRHLPIKNPKRKISNV